MLHSSLLQPCTSRQGAFGCPRQRCLLKARKPVIAMSIAESASQEPVIEHSDGPVKEPVTLPRISKAAMQKLQGKATGVLKPLTDALDSTSFTIVGNDSHLNWAFAEALASSLGWFPANTAKIISGLEKTETVMEGRASAAAAEAEVGVLAGMRSQKRVVLATLAGGAAARAETYRDLQGTFIIWIEEEDRVRPAPRTKERMLLEQQADIRIKIKKSNGFARLSVTTQEKAKEGVTNVLPRLGLYLRENKDIVEKKKRYIELGCRGDWPDLQPADWNPVTQNLSRTRVQESEA